MRTKVTQASRAYDFLKERITSWSLRPGDPLIEPDLADQLGVSRTPVREALQRLEREGLVRSIQGKGAFVADLSLADVSELYQMREILETGAIELACNSPSREVIRPLVERLAGADKMIGPDDSSAYYALIAELDRSILALTGNQKLRRALEEVWTQMRRVRNMAALDATRLRETIVEHQEIYSAVLDGNATRAAELLQRHLRASRENALAPLIFNHSTPIAPPR